MPRPIVPPLIRPPGIVLLLLGGLAIFFAWMTVDLHQLQAARQITVPSSSVGSHASDLPEPTEPNQCVTSFESGEWVEHPCDEVFVTRGWGYEYELVQYLHCPLGCGGSGGHKDAAAC